MASTSARLEGLAPPGGICVSAAVFDQVRNRIDAPTADLGRQSFKNIDQPIHAYSIGKVKPHRRGHHRSGHRVGVAAALAIVALAGAFFLFGGNGVAPDADAAPVLVVYPFDAIGEDDRLGQIGDGLRHELARIKCKSHLRAPMRRATHGRLGHFGRRFCGNGATHPKPESRRGKSAPPPQGSVHVGKDCRPLR